MNDTARTGATDTTATPARAVVLNSATGRPRHEPLAPELRTSEGTERRKERAVVLRVMIYVVVAHLLAGFIWLLFVLGAHGN
ncbi:DUF6126 family protein [Streptomyces sp. SPB162]|uniref:DUF6126 family protein n=1 Tax=Streptomyces sp. SPB162 TaxID=2940560 RepID=UPI00240623B7|nr:DUF6126 family protein [Streptomyces sp. SPB162]MDF9816611.1 type VI protein secretion system component VasF [Streptomyces sp. SPB162]